MTHETPPQRDDYCCAGDYLIALAEWLAEPDRRRLGNASLHEFKAAVREMQ